jgi:hypothetical protein
MEYLMPDTVVQGFLAEDLESESQVTDRLVDTMYNIFLGQDTPEKTLAAQEMTYLSTSENKIVCAIALFNLANPYFYDNTEFTTQHATRLAEEFPDSELARMAQNLPVLSYRKTDHLPTQEDTKFSTKSTNLDWTSSFQARVEQLAESLDSKKSSRAALAPMQDGALNGSDWRERFACLLMLEDERKGGDGTTVRPIAEQLARRTDNAPDVVRARILLARQNSRAAAENANLNSVRDASVYWAEALLDTKITQLTPERTLWEDRMKAIKFCAQDLKEGGHLAEAEKLYSALAAEFPNSLVEQECNEAVAEIHSQPAAHVSQ